MNDVYIMHALFHSSHVCVCACVCVCAGLQCLSSLTCRFRGWCWFSLCAIFICSRDLLPSMLSADSVGSCRTASVNKLASRAHA